MGPSGDEGSGHRQEEEWGTRLLEPQSLHEGRAGTGGDVLPQSLWRDWSADVGKLQPGSRQPRCILSFTCCRGEGSFSPYDSVADESHVWRRPQLPSEG